MNTELLKQELAKLSITNVTELCKQLKKETQNNQERSITLTNEEWSSVETYLMFTGGFFIQMIEVWEKFAQKKDSDGNLENPVVAKELELLRKANQSAWKLLSEI